MSSGEIRLDADGVDELIDRLYVQGWNAALARVERELYAVDHGARRVLRAEVLTILLNLTRPVLGRVSKIDFERGTDNGEG